MPTTIPYTTKVLLKPEDTITGFGIAQGIENGRDVLIAISGCCLLPVEWDVTKWTGSHCTGCGRKTKERGFTDSTIPLTEHVIYWLKSWSGLKDIEVEVTP